MVKVYFPEPFKNADVERLITGMTLGLHERPAWSFDEKGFWVEVPDESAEEWREVIQAVLRRPKDTAPPPPL